MALVKHDKDCNIESFNPWANSVIWYSGGAARFRNTVAALLRRKFEKKNVQHEADI